ncbi:conserved Plasmodium protein, unknown function [Plasmodium gallinaceum]|uniref:Uncharacterized protein n=1 Tax=Plasmodium gallinaceum TaxID=5849 RepID=A0A1J1GP93_PLAGA|nr:conserved Plasmodium protein, unknown function [Plasmodium gallinaceum]CRG94116.1 conserved Plasmodium protein, unknown function [Plasmodium gallinaceum]
MSDNYHFLQLCNIYKDSRNKWPLRINKLNFNIDNYKTVKTKIFLYILWNTVIFTYLLEFFMNLLFAIYMPYINTLSKTIFFFSIFDSIIVIILTCRGFYAYSNDKSNMLHKSAKFFFMLSIWCFIKLLVYVIHTLSFALITNEKINNELYYYGSKSVYFSYFMEIIITVNIIKFVLTLFTGQKIQYIVSCIRTSTILKSKIRKDLEKQSFLFDDFTYGTFISDLKE